MSAHMTATYIRYISFPMTRGRKQIEYIQG